VGVEHAVVENAFSTPAFLTVWHFLLPLFSRPAVGPTAEKSLAMIIRAESMLWFWHVQASCLGGAFSRSKLYWRHVQGKVAAENCAERKHDRTNRNDAKCVTEILGRQK